MSYLPIEDYGIIGDMHTVALCGKNGAIDWFCYPHFDSGSVFAALLDDAKGGRFQIAAAGEHATQKQFYWPDTNVLVTRFLSEAGVGEVIDFMPVGKNRDGTQIIRQVQVLHGDVRFHMTCQPAFNYARDPHTLEVNDGGAAFHTGDLSMALATHLPLTRVDGYMGEGVTTTFDLHAGETTTFVLCEINPDDSESLTLSEDRANVLFQDTVHYWQNWLEGCTYTGRWREQVYRSALALKLMTFEPTGAIVAAPTSSLPEGIGGVRNWDYRYTWLRDAAFSVYALMRIGFTEEAGAFMAWVRDRCGSGESESEGPLQPLYGLDGRTVIPEETLDHLEGYRGSSPVRIGNAAYQQFQNDVYGEVMDAIYLFNKYGKFVTYETWQVLRDHVDWVCDNWQRPDLGPWEVRGERQHFVFSRLMNWVAIDRGLRLADKRSFPCDRERWRQVRDTIYEEVMARGYNEDLGAFTQAYDSTALDASNLIMPLVFFTAADEPRILDTIEQTMQLKEDGGLSSGGMVYRYNTDETDDGLPGEEGAFNMCTFWLVEALTRSGQTDRARLIFERMLGYANHLGLYAEQTGMSGEALGNFPQAFTHLALISAAFNLDRALA